ncbi:MAG TPA: protoporphyrinogen oxidase [Gemmatimonadales bacterium]
MKRVAVVGGGIAGLATAIELEARGLEVLVLEGGDRVGGNLRTDREDDWIIERGPNGFLDNVPATLDLVRRVGLESSLQRANPRAAKRYLFRNGRLHLLPGGPLGFLKSPVLSVRGKLRVLLEPFARPRPEDVDETIYQFAARRIGHEAASVLVDAMVSGVFAGNVRELSLASTFPTMAGMEREHGGLVRAMLAKQRMRRAARRDAARRRGRGEDVAQLTRPGGPAGPAGTLTSCAGGLDRFPTAAARMLGDRVRMNTPVTALERDGAGGWTMVTEAGETVHADAVVLAVPAAVAAPLLEPLDGRLGRHVGAIRSASLAVVALGYDAATVGGAPDGFGFLVPRGEGPRILGCLWDSSLFPGRAPETRVLLRAMIGGAHDPAAVTLDDGTLVRIVREDLQTVMGISADPVLVRVYRHPGGIAQYATGHAARLAAIHERLTRLPGLSLTGSSYYGVSMNACIEHAVGHADRIVQWLAGDPTRRSAGAAVSTLHEAPSP